MGSECISEEIAREGGSWARPFIWTWIKQDRMPEDSSASSPCPRIKTPTNSWRHECRLSSTFPRPGKQLLFRGIHRGIVMVENILKKAARMVQSSNSYPLGPFESPAVAPTSICCFLFCSKNGVFPHLFIQARLINQTKVSLDAENTWKRKRGCRTSTASSSISMEWENQQQQSHSPLFLPHSLWNLLFWFTLIYAMNGLSIFSAGASKSYFYMHFCYGAACWDSSGSLAVKHCTTLPCYQFTAPLRGCQWKGCNYQLHS